MSIVVYWIGPTGQASHQSFEDAEFTSAMALMTQQRAGGCRHVCISSELEACVSKPGVDAVEGGALPSGHKYEWTKQHRAGARKRGRP